MKTNKGGPNITSIPNGSCTTPSESTSRHRQVDY